MFISAPSSFFKDTIVPVLGPLVTIGVLVYNNQRNRKKLEAQQTIANTAAETRHAEWKSKTDERLKEAEDRLDDHNERFDELQTKFVPRQELESKLNGIQQSASTVEKLLHMLLTTIIGRNLPSGFFIPEPKVEDKR